MLRAAILLTGLSTTLLGAQANIPQLKGDLGLSAGTQAPPGTFFGILYNNYQTNHVVGADGSTSTLVRPTINAIGVTAEYSSTFKVLGARWAAVAALPWTDIGLALPNVSTETSWGLTDAYLLPLQLGWSLPMGEVLFGQGVFLPIGRFHAGARDNTGLGMWSYETTLGGTVYLGPSKQSNLSTVASYQIQSNVRDTDERAGQVLTLEGGAGHTILKAGQLGLVYYARWKMTNDQNYPLSRFLDARDRSFGVGPEITAPVMAKPFLGLLTLRYYIEMGNRVATEGDSFYAIFTAYLPSVHHP